MRKTLNHAQMFVIAVVVGVLLLPAATFASTAAPTQISQAQYVALLTQELSLLEQQLQVLLNANKQSPVTLAPITVPAASIATSTPVIIATSTPVTQTPCQQGYTSGGSVSVNGNASRECLPNQPVSSHSTTEYPSGYFTNIMGFTCSLANHSDCSWSG